MIKTTPKNILVFSVGVVIAVLLYICAYWPASPYGKQLHNLQLAEEHAKVLSKKFSTDPKLQQIGFSVFTGRGGCLMVSGNISSEEEIHYITNVIQSIGCPVGIKYSFAFTNEPYLFQSFKEGPAH